MFLKIRVVQLFYSISLGGCLFFSQLSSFDPTKVPSSFTQKVFKYFYCIKRLSRTIQCITHIDKVYQQDAAQALLQKQTEFNHKDIIQMIQKIGSHQSLQEIASMWKTVTSYRRLNDQYFFDEFTKSLLMVYKSFFSKASTSLRLTPKVVDALLLVIDEALKADEIGRLEYLDLITEHISYFTQVPKDLKDITCKIYRPTLKISLIDAVTQRHYIIKRLNESIIYLKYIAQHIHCSKGYEQLESILPLFNHERILVCMQNICATHSLDQLFFLWDELCAYKYIDDQEFTQDVVILTFVLVRHMYTILEQEPDKVNNLFYSAYQYIESLPLEQLLQAIDSLGTELLLIIERYELNENISWKQWLSKYWWAPPLIITTIGIKLALIFKIVYSSVKSNLPSLDTSAVTP